MNMEKYIYFKDEYRGINFRDEYRGSNVYISRMNKVE